MSDNPFLDSIERLTPVECQSLLMKSFCGPEGDKCHILEKCTLPSSARVIELTNAWKLFDGTVPHQEDPKVNALITSGVLIRSSLQALTKINDPILDEQRLIVGFINHLLARDLLVIAKDKKSVVSTRIIIGEPKELVTGQRWFAQQLPGQVKLSAENASGKPMGQVSLYPEYSGIEEKRHNWSYSNASDEVFEKAGVVIVRLTYNQPGINFRLQLQGVEFLSAVDSRKHFEVFGGIKPPRKY